MSLAVAVLLGAATPAPVDAQQRTTTTARKSTATTVGTKRAELNRQLATLREQVGHASAEEASLLGRLDDVVARRKVLDGKVGTLDRQLGQLTGDLEAAEAGLESASAEVVRAQTKLNVATSGLRESRADLRRRAVDAYVRNPEAAAADLVLRVRDLRQMGAATSYLNAVVRSRVDLVDRYEALARDAQALEATVEAAHDDAKLVRDLVADRRADLARAKAEQDAVRQAVAADEAEQQKLLGEVRRRKAEFQAQITALQRESDSISALLRRLQQGQAAGGGGPLVLPVPGARLSSTFGPRVHPIYGTSRVHNGIDLAAGSGTPIRAAGAGTVITAGPRGAYGNTVIIDHGRSVATLYAHQRAVSVTVGQKVTAGQVVGSVGSTGLSTGPHLHFEVRVNGVPVNPLGYL